MLHAAFKAEEQKSPILFGVKELEALLPESFVSQIKEIDNHHKGYSEFQQEVEELANKGALGRLFAVPAGLYHGYKYDKLAIPQARYEALSDDPNVPHTYAEIFYNPEIDIPYKKGKERGAIDVKIGSFKIEEDGTKRNVGTDYEEARVNLTPTKEGIVSGSVSIFRRVGLFVSVEEGFENYVSNTRNHTPTPEEFSNHARYVLSVVKDTEKGKFRDLNAESFASVKDLSVLSVEKAGDTNLINQRKPKVSGHIYGIGASGC